MERKQKLAIWIQIESAALKECKEPSFLFHLAEDLIRHSEELAQIVLEEEKAA